MGCGSGFPVPFCARFEEGGGGGVAGRFPLLVPLSSVGGCISMEVSGEW